MKLGLGQTITHVASTSIVSLVQGVLSAMLINKLKWIGLAVFVSGLTLTGAGVLARQGTKSQQESDRPAPIASTNSATLVFPAEIKNAAPADQTKTVTSSTPNDPRQELLRAARAAYQATLESFVSRNGYSEQVYQASKRWMDAQKEIATAVSEQTAAITAHRDRLKDLTRADATRHSPGSEALVRANAAQGAAYLAEADLWLARAKTETIEKPTGNSEGPAKETRGPAKDPQSRRILAKLEEPVAMNFPTETPLDDILKHIKDTTKSPAMPKGIPIYVDPIGLQEADKSLTSTVTIDLDGVPLRRTLQLALKQLDLIYYVYDGMLYITSAESEDPNPTIEPSPLMKKQEQAERGELTLSELKHLKEMLKSLHELKNIDEKMDAKAGGAGKLQ